MRNISKLLEAVSIKVQLFILHLILNGGEEIMVMFFTQRVVLGKTAFKDVPAKLKDQVRELLIESGLEYLAIEE